MGQSGFILTDQSRLEVSSRQEMQVVDGTHDFEESVVQWLALTKDCSVTCVALSLQSCRFIIWTKKQPMCAVFADITYLPTCNAISI